MENKDQKQKEKIPEKEQEQNYLAHRDEDREQTLKEHLTGTARLAGKFAEEFGKGEWGRCCGMLHDIGKYSAAFQQRIRGKSSRMVDHSSAGAQVCLEKGGRYGFMSYCIAGHHAGLPDYGSKADTGSSPTLWVFTEDVYEQYVTSHPSRVRGLKFGRDCPIQQMRRSHPSRVRELKSEIFKV